MAGTFLAQTRGSDIDRTQQESNSQDLRAESDLKAEAAAGVGQTDGEEHQTAKRDADGRRLWEFVRRQRGSRRPATSPLGPRILPAKVAACWT